MDKHYTHESQAKGRMQVNRPIMVFCDPDILHNRDLNTELMHKALELAEVTHSEILCLLIGEFEKDYIDFIAGLGISYLIYCKHYNECFYDVYAMIAEEIYYEIEPRLILFPSTSIGKAVAATISIPLNAGLIADCIEIEADDKDGFVFSRTALNASVIARIVCINQQTMMCTVKRNIFNDLKSKNSRNRKGTVIEKSKYVNVTSKLEGAIEITEVKADEPGAEVDLSNASLVFSAGRGLSSKAIKQLQEVSRFFKADVSCTRPLVEDGIFSKNQQVGQSGIHVTPELYVAFGISGASQHIAGILNAKKIISVNTNESSPIFSFSDYIIIDDAEIIIEKLLSYTREGYQWKQLE